jgi:putative endonuclease
MSTETQLLGERGELIAARWLERSGWRVLGRRFRNGHRDIDLVVERSGTVAFVEVKARRGEAFGGPLAAVNWRKRRELVRSAHVWIERYGARGQAFASTWSGYCSTGGGLGSGTWRMPRLPPPRQGIERSGLTDRPKLRILFGHGPGLPSAAKRA